MTAPLENRMIYTQDEIDILLEVPYFILTPAQRKKLSDSIRIRSKKESVWIDIVNTEFFKCENCGYEDSFAYSYCPGCDCKMSIHEDTPAG